MALYYYKKYTVESDYVYSNETYEGQTNFQSSGSYTVNNSSYSGNLTWKRYTGYVWYSGTSGRSFTCPDDGTEMDRVVRVSDVERRDYHLAYDSGSDQVFVSYLKFTLDKRVEFSKGDYIETLIAENGSYPDNDNSGSYWYIKDVLYVAPAVSSSAATSVTHQSATINGNLTEQGEESTCEVGFQWGETFTDNTTYVGDKSEGVYSLDISSLDPNTTYYFRAYATNSHETVYGSTLSFTTEEHPLAKPTINSPDNSTKTTDLTPTFDFNLTSEPRNTATKYHARLRLAENVGMTPATTYESETETGTWEYYSGGSWLTFPSAGVNPGTRVRCTITSPLEYRTTYYWDVASSDGSDYGFNSTPRNIRAVLTVDGMYTLVIGTTEYNAFNLRVVEASNGEIGTIDFEIDNTNGLNNTAVEYGDSVVLGINDVNGNTEEFEGRVVVKQPVGQTLKIQATLGGGILGQRLIGEDYTSQDVGLVLKDAVDDYCSPLTSTGIDTSLGFSTPYPVTNWTVLSLFEDARRRYGFLYFVDRNWDVQVYNKADMTDPKWRLQFGNITK